MQTKYEIGKIEVQPDRLIQLPGKNRYELLSLKRAVVDGFILRDGSRFKFRLVLDERANLLTIEAKGCPVPAMTIGIAFMAEFTRLSRISEPMLPTGGDEHASVYTFAVDTPINVLGLLHHIRENKGFEDED